MYKIIVRRDDGLRTEAEGVDFHATAYRAITSMVALVQDINALTAAAARLHQIMADFPGTERAVGGFGVHIIDVRRA